VALNDCTLITTEPASARETKISTPSDAVTFEAVCAIDTPSFRFEALVLVTVRSVPGLLERPTVPTIDPPVAVTK